MGERRQGRLRRYRLGRRGHEPPGRRPRPFLGELGPSLALEGTELGLDGELELGGRDPAATRGRGKIVWRRGEEVLLAAEDAEVRLVLDARVWPGRTGMPAARGSLVAKGLDDLEGRLGLEAGQPARHDLIAGAAVRLERLLREQGRAAARVRSEVEAFDPEANRLAVTLHALNAKVFRIADIEFEGRHATRRRWAERATGLEAGELVRGDLAFPFDRREEDRDFELYLGFGYSF